MQIGTSLVIGCLLGLVGSAAATTRLADFCRQTPHDFNKKLSVDTRFRMLIAGEISAGKSSFARWICAYATESERPALCNGFGVGLKERKAHETTKLEKREILNITVIDTKGMNTFDRESAFRIQFLASGSIPQMCGMDYLPVIEKDEASVFSFFNEFWNPPKPPACRLKKPDTELIPNVVVILLKSRTLREKNRDIEDFLQELDTTLESKRVPLWKSVLKPYLDPIKPLIGITHLTECENATSYEDCKNIFYGSSFPLIKKRQRYMFPVLFDGTAAECKNSIYKVHCQENSGYPTHSQLYQHFVRIQAHALANLETEHAENIAKNQFSDFESFLVFLFSSAIFIAAVQYLRGQN